ncbi:MAG: hypothetical protein Q7U18_07960, partial [Methylobacter sp.]|nr:hypothetical protein [Methylobacter sp.]
MKAIASRFGILSGCKQPPCTYMWARIHSRIQHSQSVFSANEFAPTFYDHAIRKDEDMKAIASRFGMLSGCKQPPCTYMWARIHSRIQHSQSVFSTNEFAPTFYDHAIRKDEDMKAIASRFGMLSGCKQPPCTY